MNNAGEVFERLRKQDTGVRSQVVLSILRECFPLVSGMQAWFFYRLLADGVEHRCWETDSAFCGYGSFRAEAR